MKIVKIADNVQALLEDTGLFVTVDPAPQDGEQTSVQFEGYPAVSHYFGGVDGEIATSSQNRRAIRHVIEVFLVTPDAPKEVEFRQAWEMTDKLLDVFDKSRDLSSQKLGLGRACHILRPAPAEPMRVSTSQGDGLMVTITLTCEADVSNR